MFFRKSRFCPLQRYLKSFGARNSGSGRYSFVIVNYYLHSLHKNRFKFYKNEKTKTKIKTSKH